MNVTYLFAWRWNWSRWLWGPWTWNWNLNCYKLWNHENYIPHFWWIQLFLTNLLKGLSCQSSQLRRDHQKDASKRLAKPQANALDCPCRKHSLTVRQSQKTVIISIIQFKGNEFFSKIFFKLWVITVIFLDGIDPSLLLPKTRDLFQNSHLVIRCLNIMRRWLLNFKSNKSIIFHVLGQPDRREMPPAQFLDDHVSIHHHLAHMDGMVAAYLIVNMLLK